VAEKETMKTATLLSHRTLGRLTTKSTHRVVGHLLVRSVVRSPRSYVRALAHSLAPKLMGNEVDIHEMNASISYGFNPQCIGPTRIESHEAFWHNEFSVQIHVFPSWPDLVFLDKRLRAVDFGLDEGVVGIDAFWRLTQGPRGLLLSLRLHHVVPQ